MANLIRAAIAEVLTSSITGLTAEAVPPVTGDSEPASKPKFGSFVRIESPENNIDIFAVVFDVVTNPPDSVHKPAALGMSRSLLRLEQPHIFALLKTHMQAAVIGYRSQQHFYQHLPPQPAEVHDFVFEASASEVCTMTNNFDFLRLLAHINSVPTDELIAAAIRRAALARAEQAREDAVKNCGQVDLAGPYLIEAGRALSQLFRSDYDRMISIVKKIRPTEND